MNAPPRISGRSVAAGRHVLGAAALGALFVVIALGLTASAAAGPGPDVRSSARDVPPLVLDEQPEPLQPRRPRTEQDRDRLEAVTLFAAGRMREHAGRTEQALRDYQRALRRDPEALDVARAIVPLAYDLKRNAVAVRYALKVVELEDADPMLLRQLGVYLTREGDFSRAVELYKRAADAQGGTDRTAADVLLRMEMGRLYHLTEDYQNAADSFDHVLAALENPKQFGIDEKLEEILLGEAGPTYNLMGECFLEAGRLDRAEKAFRQAHQAAANQGVLDFHLAQVLAARGRPKQALAKLDACFRQKVDSEDTAPYELLARLLEDLGRPGDLIPRLEELQTDDPGNVPLGYFLADQYRAAGQSEKAELLYLALLKKKATTSGYRGLAEIHRKSGLRLRLLEILGEAVALTDTLETFGPEADAILGDADLVDSLLETARKTARDEPDKLTFGMRYAAALLALQTKRFGAAEEMLDLAIKARPDEAAELLLVWGVELLLSERFEEAVRVFQRGIDEKVLPEDNPAFYYYMAGALALDEKIDEALGAARKAAERKPDSARYQSRVAWVLYIGERYDAASKAYEELLDKFDKDHDSTETREVLRDARLSLSNLCVIRGDLDMAQEWLEQVLDEFPDDAGASNDLGYLWADENKHLHLAVAMIEWAVAAEPENAAYRDSLGWVYYRLGRISQAVIELEKAAAGDNEPDGVILDHLGDAYLAAGQAEKAQAAWRRAVEAFKKQKEDAKAQAVEKKIAGQK
jgi:tetratricopeptide (TPR) repeat protein